jgi:hypothetical protein
LLGNPCHKPAKGLTGYPGHMDNCGKEREGSEGKLEHFNKDNEKNIHSSPLQQQKEQQYLSHVRCH